MTKLSDDICSPQDLTTLILEVKEYARWYEHESIKRRATSAPQSTQPILSPTTAIFLRSVSTNGTLQSAQLDAIIKELENYKTSAPTVTITLAAPVTEHVKKMLTAWCRTELSPAILVSFEYNRTLLGGMVIRYGSHVHDWSFRRTLLTTPLKFSEVLARV
jgi:F0F1-type ATP synthase delta subunit